MTLTEKYHYRAIAELYEALEALSSAPPLDYNEKVVARVQNALRGYKTLAELIRQNVPLD